MNAAPTLSVCVYCGSRAGAEPAYADAARAVGASIGRRGWQLVYGGARVGLMGIVADAALAAGARVVGVIPQGLTRRELGHAGVSELLVVGSMHERKQLMAERSDAFLALPGGIGTFEEMFEAWTWRQLGIHDKPLGLLNAGGYYDGLLAFLAQAVQRGFLDAGQRAMLEVDASPDALLDRLGAAAPRAAVPDDYRLI